MKCPNCREEMTSVPTKDNTSQVFEFEKCGHCGGFYFAGSDLFRLSKSEAEKYDTHDTSVLSKDLTCQKCQQEMVKIKDPYIPSTINLFRCGLCGGYFIPAANLKTYKHYQAQRMKPQTNRREAVLLTALALLAYIVGWSYVYFLEKGSLSIFAEESGQNISPTVSFLSHNYLFLVSSAVAILGFSFYLFSRRFKNIILITVLLLSLTIFSLGYIYR
jgi:Zn-finger nucleic acid-binding protein